MMQKTYRWRPATADDIGRVARFFDNECDVEFDCHTFGILESIEPHNNVGCFIGLSPASGSIPYRFCEVQEVSE